MSLESSRELKLQSNEVAWNIRKKLAHPGRALAYLGLRKEEDMAN